MNDRKNPFRHLFGLEWGRFLKKNLHLLLIWPLAAIITGIVGWNLLFAQLEKTRAQVESNLLTQAKSEAQVFSDRLQQTFESLDQLLLHVRYEWELSQGLLPLESIKETGIFPAP